MAEIIPAISISGVVCAEKEEDDEATDLQIEDDCLNKINKKYFNPAAGNSAYRRKSIFGFNARAVKYEKYPMMVLINAPKKHRVFLDEEEESKGGASNGSNSD